MLHQQRCPLIIGTSEEPNIDVTGTQYNQHYRMQGRVPYRRRQGASVGSSVRVRQLELPWTTLIDSFCFRYLMLHFFVQIMFF